MIEGALVFDATMVGMINASHAQPFDAVDAQLVIYDRIRVAVHAAGADRGDTK